MSWFFKNDWKDTTLLVSVFSEFIDVVNENKRYTIGLISVDNNILSCSDPSYVHFSKQALSEIPNSVILDLVVNNMKLGYLWVQGNDSLKMMSGLLLESLSTRILFEFNDHALQHKNTIDDELIKHLIQEDFDRSHVLKLIHDLKINQNITRVAILVHNPKGFDSSEISRLKTHQNSIQTLYSQINKRNLLIFKDIPENLSNDEMKLYLGKYIATLQKWGLQDSSYSIGSMQNRIINYRHSYQNCLWVFNSHAPQNNEIAFFTDFPMDYFASHIDLEDVIHYIDYYIDRCKFQDIDALVEIANELTNNNHNITQTAENLFLHKNTLIYKIKRYEEIFNIDIRGSFQGKVLFALIAKTLEEYQKQQQVGEKI